MDFDNMLRYCAELELNNDREWFHATHDRYDEAKADFIELVNILKYTVADNAGQDLSSRLIFAEPKNMLYRIPRDARVYKNQPPYNPSFRALICEDKHALMPLGYYIMIAPGNRSEFGTGLYGLEPEKLASVRDYIVENWERLEEILDSGVTPDGERLKRVPRGYDPEHPAAEILKFKSLGAIVTFKDAELSGFDSFAERIGEAVRKMEPMREFLTDAYMDKKTPLGLERWR